MRALIAQAAEAAALLCFFIFLASRNRKMNFTNSDVGLVQI
jgi:hypothetical protein